VFIPYATEKRSFKDDEQRAGVVKEFFKGRQVRDVTPMLIEKFKSDLRKRRTKFRREMSAATVNRYLQVLSKVLALAYDNGLIDSNPMSRIRRLREPAPRERYLTGEEEERLLTALRSYGERAEALAALGLDTGLRLSELLRLRWEDVGEASVHVRSDGVTARTKNDRPRNVPLTLRAKKVLSSLRQGAPGHELVFNHKKTGRRRRQMLVCYTRALAVAKIEGATFHTLRHTFATRLRAAGVHEFDIMALLGHSSTKVTQGYAHSVESKLREAVALMSGSNVLEFRREEAAG
jgi:integrase